MSRRGAGAAVRPEFIVVSAIVAALVGVLVMWPVPGATASPPPPQMPPDQAAGAFTSAAAGRPAAMPLDEGPPDDAQPAAGCARTPRPRGWVAIENRKPGTGAWRVPSYGGDRGAPVGYLDRTTASCGDTVSLHLSGRGPWTRVTAIRMGWYGGTGGRAVWTSGPIRTAPQAAPRVQARTHMVEARWRVSARVPVTPAWVPGMYLLVLRSAQGARSVVPLVVRDAHPGSPLLYTASSLTWQAYNKFGGYSLYHGRRHDVAGRSRVASFNRPYDSGGIRSLMVHDVPLVRYLEQLGHDVDYTDDLDLDQRPSQLLQHRALVIPGHSEYWTTRMYDAVEFARDAGVNVAFLGANQVYWHARLEVGPGAARRRMAVYRDRREDEAGRRDPALTTVTWSSPPLDRPQLSLTGAAFGKYGTVAHYRVVSANSWIFAGTALRDGSVLRQAVAGEWDRVVADPRTPENVEVLAEAPIITHQGQATMATMSYYTAPSGAGVFNAGVTFWPCHLYGTCPGRQAPAATRRALRTITANVLRAFAREPAGRRHPSVPRMPHDPASLVRSARPADVAIMPALSGE